MISTTVKPYDKAKSSTEEISLQLSVSEHAYTTKPDKETILAMKFNQQLVPVSQFVEQVQQGYCFCHWFNTLGSFGVSEKKIANFSCANTVFIDIDKSEIDMYEYVKSLSIQPTVCYTTPSNNAINGVYCYRLCYVINTDINSPTEYKAIYKSIAHSLQEDVPNVKLDNHVGNVSQYVNGNGNGCCEIISNDISYSPAQFAVSYTTPIRQHREISEPLERDYSKLIRDVRFIEDFHKLSPVALRDKYEEKYPFFDKSPLIQMDGYYIYPEDYTEIKRKWRWDSFAKSDKEKKYFKSGKLIKDGEGRRNKLFTGCLIRRQIKPDVSFEHLLMNLVYERLYYFDNSDKVLTNTTLMAIAYNALMVSPDEITIPRHRPYGFSVDKEYCEANGITVSKMRGDVRREQKDEIIGQYYDCNLSIRKNVDLLKKYGHKISYSRIREFINQHLK